MARRFAGLQVPYGIMGSFGLHRLGPLGADARPRRLALLWRAEQNVYRNMTLRDLPKLLCWGVCSRRRCGAPVARVGRAVGCVEPLEPRRLLAFDPSAMEQAMLEDINRMRIDPQGELDYFFVQTQPLLARSTDVQAAVNFFNVDAATLLSQWARLEPAPPVAWHESLYEVARAHDQVMIEMDEQAHVLEGEPGIGQRVQDAGYDFTAVVENVFAFGKSTLQAHAGFVIDWGDTPSGIQDPPGHRRNMMNRNMQEVGAAIVQESDPDTAVGPLVITQDFASRSDYVPQVLGVVYDDRNGNGRYDAGEGLGGMSIEAVGAAQTYRTTTMTAGGYQLEVPHGTYAVVASGPRLSGRLALTGVVMAGTNVKADINIRTALPGPTALADFGSTMEDVPVSINVLANDSSANGPLDWSSIQIAEYPARGTLEVLAATGEIRYQPTANFSGTDRFRYRVRNGQGVPSNEANVVVTVAEVNDLPVARNDISTVDEDFSTRLDILRNDSDVDGSLAAGRITIVRAPAAGEVIVDGSLLGATYVPHADYVGTDTFTYRVEDNHGASSNVATVNITVRQVNDAPVAADDSLVTRQETPVRAELLANDTDVDGAVQPASLGLTRFPQHGDVRIDRATGAVTYTPRPGFHGRDSFAYAVRDDRGALSSQGVVSVLVAEKDFPWHNPADPLDVDNDGQVGTLDALLVIQDLMKNYARRLLTASDAVSAGPPFVDTNRDGLVSPLDALLVIRSHGAASTRFRSALISISAPVS